MYTHCVYVHGTCERKLLIDDVIYTHWVHEHAVNQFGYFSILQLCLNITKCSLLLIIQKLTGI